MDLRIKIVFRDVHFTVNPGSVGELTYLASVTTKQMSFYAVTFTIVICCMQKHVAKLL